LLRVNSGCKGRKEKLKTTAEIAEGRTEKHTAQEMIPRRPCIVHYQNATNLELSVLPDQIMAIMALMAILAITY
jgi:hypothetical protein